MLPVLKLGWLDVTIILGYLAFLLSIAWRTRRQAEGSEIDFLLAGRRLSLPAFIATLVSTWYGGILGVGEYSFLYGISNWLVFGVPYYLAAFIFAIFIARKARNSEVLSIPDQLERAYGKAPAVFGASILFIVTVPAAYILMLGLLLQAFFGGTLLLWLIVGALFSTVYVAFGGFKSVVRTDVIQFVLMFTGFVVLLSFAVVNYGGITFLQENIPKTHFQWHGGLHWSAIAVWYIIALATLVEPSFYQRCYAAKSPKIAKKGILLSILFWIIFDATTTFSGLYARAILSENINPILSFPLLAQELLPVGIYGIFILSLIAIVMSTIDSYSFLAAQTLGRDIIQRIRNDSSNWNVKYVQYGLIASNAIAVVLAIWKESVVDLWHDLGSIGTPVLLLPLGLSLFRKSNLNGKAVFLSMILSCLVATFWIFYQSHTSDYPFGIRPIFAGLTTSIIVLLPSIILNRR